MLKGNNKDTRTTPIADWTGTDEYITADWDLRWRAFALIVNII